MLPRTFKHLCAVLLAIVFLGEGMPLLAQVFDLDKDREPMVVMDGLWRFHPGDDPHWAARNFDDSDWPLISSEQSWSDQGYKNMGGMAWYRVKVHVPKGAKPLSLYVPDILTSYQVFIDGNLVGGFGGMPPHEKPETGPSVVYPVTQFSASQEQTLSLAIRIWHWPYAAKYVGGGLTGGVRIGSTELIRDRAIFTDHANAWSMASQIFLAMLECLAGLAALAFFLLRRKEREYMWFGSVLMFSSAFRCLTVYHAFHPMDFEEGPLLQNLLWAGGAFATIGFYFSLLRGRRNWLFWSAVASILAEIAALAAQTEMLISPKLGNALIFTLPVIMWVWISGLLIQQARRGLPDARLLLLPAFLQGFGQIAGSILYVGRLTGWYHIPSGWLYDTAQWPFPFTLFDVADASFLVAMLAILVYRFTRTRRDEERFANELEAARAVQSVLIPTEIPKSPGFAISAVYKPAAQVGGDLFQIIPTRSGGLLVAIGDVSGKGMPAAMTVSLLVGTIRTLAHFTQSPGEILAAMNQRMLARSSGGFTTCLILSADADGTLTIANAGHLAPYRNGIELPIENGLPLGLAADTEYHESGFQLAEGEQLTFLTDGVVEARSKSGELFGFTRAASIATSSVEAIAKAAQDFGQEDDITVLTITRTSRVEERAAEMSAPDLSPSPA